MGSVQRTRRALMQTEARNPMLLADWQRRVVMMLMVSGLCLAVIGAALPPRGFFYWFAVVAALLGGGAAGLFLGGGVGRALEARLLRSDTPREPLPLPEPGALAPAERAALQATLLPLLLAELRGAAERTGPRERAAALLLAERSATASGEARQALLQALPRLIAAFTSGQPAAADEAEALAQRLAPPMRGRG